MNNGLSRNSRSNVLYSFEIANIHAQNIEQMSGCAELLTSGSVAMPIVLSHSTDILELTSSSGAE